MSHMYLFTPINQGKDRATSFDHPLSHNSNNCSYKVNKSGPFRMID